MLSKAQIIVLNTIKYGDNGLVVQCYSNSGGKLSLFLRGTGRNKSNAAYLHRLNILDVEIPHMLVPVRPGRNLAIVIEAAARYFISKTRGANPAEEMERRMKRLS